MYSLPRSTRCVSLSAERDESLVEAVVRDARDRGCTIALAESCTGGLLGARITDVPGSSAVFWGSVVSYANEAKRSLLGVAAATLETHGAVSEAVVLAMAEGVRRLSNADVALSVSGVAGPDGGTEDKPVGTVWICCVTDWSNPTSRLFRFSGDRGIIRCMAVEESLRLIRRMLETRSLGKPG